MRLYFAFAHIQTLFFLIVALFFVPLQIMAQTDDPASSELLENFFRDNESASESDAQQFLENLDMLRDRQLDLNRASRAIELRAWSSLTNVLLPSSIPAESFRTTRL